MQIGFGTVSFVVANKLWFEKCYDSLNRYWRLQAYGLILKKDTLTQSTSWKNNILKTDFF